MIRRLFTFFFSLIVLVAVAAGVFCLYSPKKFDEYWWEIRREWHEFTHNRELKFDGLRVLTEEDLEVRLPLDRSNFWWILNANQIEAGLLGHPLIRRADVSRCSLYSFACFRLALTERQARYIVEVDQQHWVVGDDSAFIAPAPAGEQLDDTILITGLSQKGSSPDAVRARVALVRSALEKIERAAKMPVREVHMLPEQEFEVTFIDYNLIVRFDLTEEGGAIGQQSERLARLFKEFEGRLPLIRSIDLAFNKMAVVKLVEGVEPTASAKKGSS